MSQPETDGHDASTSFINDVFITSVLRRDENDASLVVVNSVVENAVPKGDNYGSVIVRVAVDYTVHDVKKHRSIIVKSEPEGEVVLMYMQQNKVFDRELRIYSVTLPAMYKLHEDKTGKRFQAAPNCFQTDRPETIVLEDLRPEGYKMANRLQGLDYDHCVVALRTLARLHAASVALHEQDPDSVEYYTEICYTQKTRSFHADFMDPTFRSLANVVETWPGFERFGVMMRKVAEELIDKVIDIMHRDSPLKVFCHGDFWTNNMLFRYDDGKVQDLKMLDFQNSRFASPALDIIYFLNTSPTQAILEEFEDELVAIYLDEFNKALESLGCSRHGLSKEQLDRELSECGYYSVFCSIVSSIMTADPEDAPKFDELTEANIGQDAGSMMDKAFAGKKFRHAFERRLVKFEEQGLMQ